MWCNRRLNGGEGGPAGGGGGGGGNERDLRLYLIGSK